MLARLKTRAKKDALEARLAANASQEAENQAMAAFEKLQMAQQTANIKKALAEKANRIREESLAKAAKSADMLEAAMIRSQEALLAQKIAAARVAELANDVSLQNKIASFK